MSLVPSLKVANLGTLSFTVNSFLSYLRLTVKIFQFLRLSTKFLAVLRLSVNPIETLIQPTGLWSCTRTRRLHSPLFFRMMVVSIERYQYRRPFWFHMYREVRHHPEDGFQ